MFVQTDIETLKQEISLMARKAESLFEKTVKALETRDEELAKEVIALDKELDQYELKMDSHCESLLALKDPYAIDFRYVFSIIKTTRDLERVGDECKTISKWSLKFKGSPNAEMLSLAKETGDALNTAVSALTALDLEKAALVLEIEKKVDALEDKIINESTDLPTAFIAKAFERISDMATNIAENVVYCVKAKDIRHGGFQKSE